jgi:hypothetical protein
MGLVFQHKWSAVSQSGPPTYEIFQYITYQYNVLKNPTGLMGLGKRVSTTGSNYTTQFHLYISDSGNHVIRDFNGYTGYLSTVAGTLGTAGYINGSVGSAQFNYPTGLSGQNSFTGAQTGCDQWYYPPYGHCCASCIQPHITYYNAQEIYVNDSQNFVMRRICTGDAQAAAGDCSGLVGQVVTACGSGVFGYADSSTANASFKYLAGISVDGYYMADAGNHAIRGWDGAYVTTYAGTGVAGFYDGYRTSAQFNAPVQMTKDTAGNMYVADSGNNAIRKVDTSGYVTTIAGAGPSQPGYVDGQGSSATFFRPTSVLFNPADGMTYVADSHNNCIRRIDSAGNVTTYAGTGQPGLVNGPRATAQFSLPTDLVIHNGFMFISDSMNNVIRAIDMSTGEVLTYIS